MRTRRLPLLIPSEDYDRLVQLGKREERDPIQQARYLLRRALATAPDIAEETTKDRGRDERVAAS